MGHLLTVEVWGQRESFLASLYDDPVSGPILAGFLPWAYVTGHNQLHNPTRGFELVADLLCDDLVVN
jgi:hypothetical protein